MLINTNKTHICLFLDIFPIIFIIMIIERFTESALTIDINKCESILHIYAILEMITKMNNKNKLFG